MNKAKERAPPPEGCGAQAFCVITPMLRSCLTATGNRTGRGGGTRQVHQFPLKRKRSTKETSLRGSLPVAGPRWAGDMGLKQDRRAKDGRVRAPRHTEANDNEVGADVQALAA